mmetsp:Transcript_21780/g.55588  ORF Transcript_21780/g.55588 Transcript_21780/m.55588 type:complete len:200 (-) Transcript_21780:44-643(-)
MARSSVPLERSTLMPRRQRGARRRWDDGGGLAGHRLRAAAARARCCSTKGSPAAASTALARSVRHRAGVGAFLRRSARSPLQCSATVGCGPHGAKERLDRLDSRSRFSLPPAAVQAAYARGTAGDGSRHRGDGYERCLGVLSDSWIVLFDWVAREQRGCVYARGLYSSEHVSLMHLPPYKRNVWYAGRGHVCGVSTQSF